MRVEILLNGMTGTTKLGTLHKDGIADSGRVVSVEQFRRQVRGCLTSFLICEG